MSGTTLWRVNGSSNLCSLSHFSTGDATCEPNGRNNVFTARPGSGFGPGTTATSFLSTLSGTATLALNGTLVECFGPAIDVDPWNRVGISATLIVG